MSLWYFSCMDFQGHHGTTPFVQKCLFKERPWDTIGPYSQCEVNVTSHSIAPPEQVEVRQRERLGTRCPTRPPGSWLQADGWQHSVLTSPWMSS